MMKPISLINLAKSFRWGDKRCYMLLQILFLSMSHLPLQHLSVRGCQTAPSVLLNAIKQLPDSTFSCEVALCFRMWNLLLSHHLIPISFFSQGHQQSQDLVLLRALFQPKCGQCNNFTVLLNLQSNKWDTPSQGGCQRTACWSMRHGACNWNMWLRQCGRCKRVSSSLCKCLHTVSISAGRPASPYHLVVRRFQFCQRYHLTSGARWRYGSKKPVSRQNFLWHWLCVSLSLGTIYFVSLH